MIDKPNISTYRAVKPMVYSYILRDYQPYEGWEKIGYTTRDVDTRIAEQGSELKRLEKQKLWARRAIFTSEAGGTFDDHDFHRYLKRQGIEREPGSEWHRFDNVPQRSIDYFVDFQGEGFDILPNLGGQDYVLRPEQVAAIEQALDAFTDGYDEVLWNAKPRFGKTLTAYDLMRQMDAQKVLIVTNRPAIANSWYDDFATFIAHQTGYHFVSESSSLAQRNPMGLNEFTKFRLAHQGEDIRRIEFVSLQDLKGSERFGGKYDKNKYISELNWDLLIIDEAHEGVDTLKTDVAFDQITRNKTLHLSGTPFKALASGKFSAKQIYNWTYEDEQTAKRDWDNPEQENPYEQLPTLNLYTYQMSRMIEERLEEGVAASDDEDAENIDYTFDLNQFFETKENGAFKYENSVIKFLDRLTEGEKYPFSTPELRNEIRHSFWLLERVASAKALKKLLNKHPVFKDYEVVLAAGDGRDDADAKKIGKALDEVRKAIKNAEETGGKTITLSVGQLTTGVTVPEWTAVMMLSNMKSPAQYMQAAFRAQNPCSFERNGELYEKDNAYVFDFAPERTLITFDKFANNLNQLPAGDPQARRESIRALLNFFPIIGEDSEGKMMMLDAEQVLAFPKAFKAREVVRRGFMSNLLFDNVAGIFRNPEHYKPVLDKLPPVKEGKVKKNEEVTVPDPVPNVDDEGVATADEIIINAKSDLLGKPKWGDEDLPEIEPQAAPAQTAKKIADRAIEKSHATFEKAKEEYKLTKKQVETYERDTRRKVEDRVQRAVINHQIATKRLDDEIKEAATETEVIEIQEKQTQADDAFWGDLRALAEETTDSIGKEVATKEENKKVQKQADKTMNEARDHLRGFARTIPMFLMAYGDRDMTLANFDDYTPDDVFEEITGITEAEFRFLRDGQDVTEEDGTITRVPGLFDADVFDQSVQEFLNKKEELANYFDPSLNENIFAYIPQQKTSLVFTPEKVVKQMVDILETENPGIFNNPNKTFADLFSTAGLFLMEIVRRLDAGLQDVIPDQQERLLHILTSQVFEMSHNELLHRITIEAVSGGVPERKAWIENSGHYRVGDISKMSPDERQQVVDEMLSEGASNE